MKVFISYSHRDETHQQILLGHLKSAGLNGLDPVSDDRLKPGDLWEEELMRYMDQADAGILLLSSSFLNSQWCRFELDYLSGRERPLRLFPVLVDKCFWQGVPILSKLQLVNPKAPVSAAQSLEAGWYEVAHRIYEVLSAMQMTTDRPVGQPPPRQSPEGKWEKITKAIRKGTFTPVLGPGCYEVTEKTRQARDHVRVRLDLILEKIGADKSARDYAEGVVASSLKEAIDHTVTGEKRASPGWLGLLLDLQSELSRLGATCCNLMGLAMQKHTRGFTDIASIGVDLEEDLEASSRVSLRSRFFESTDLAGLLDQFIQALPQDEKRTLECLGIYGIRAQLFMLTYSIFHFELGSRLDEEGRQWKDRHSEFLGIAGRLIRPGEGARLSLAQVEWIGDLLWHTIRFDAPMYPSPDELAFQLSACFSAPPRKVKVGTIVELVNKEDRANIISKLFKVYEGNPSERRKDPHGFYDAIARTLFYSLRIGSASKSRVFRGSGPEAAARKPVTIAISTNFDRELEKAMAAFKRPFHLLFPVYAGREGDDGANGQDAWLLRTFRVDGDGQGEWDDEILVTNPNSLKRFGFEGPLVVKLYGSPQEKLKIKSNYSHRVSISDCDFIEAMLSRERYWPPDLKDLLVLGGRVLCFLGYPLTDANSRLRLSDHLDGEQRDRTLFLIDYPEDPLRHTFLEHINVNLVPTPVEEFLISLKRFFNQFPEAD